MKILLFLCIVNMASEKSAINKMMYQKIYYLRVIVNGNLSCIFLLRFIKNQNSVGQLFDVFVKSSIYLMKKRLDAGIVDTFF